MNHTDRDIYITAETITQLFREYIGKHLVPPDARPVAFKLNYSGVPGLIGIRIASGDYSGIEPDETVDFKLERGF